jgi:FkbM family methyltransferase
MTREKHKRIYRELSAKGFKPEHVAEVGVYNPGASNLSDYIARGVRCTLVEPDPASVGRIKSHLGQHENVTLHPVAVYDFNGEVSLIQQLASTYVSELTQSPVIVNDGYAPSVEDRFTVRAVTFDKIDDGSIDLLSVDVEGSEWFVIKHMVSRPAVISVETHGALYINPYMREISGWMRRNGYDVWYKGKTDSVYVKRGSISVSGIDRMRLMVMDAYLFLRRARRRIGRSLRRHGLFRDRKGAPSDAPVSRETIVGNLIDAYDLLEALGVRCWLTDGTLLGYFRDRDILGHDVDVDLGCFIEDYSDAIISDFKKKGWRLEYVFGRKKLGLELSFTRHGAKVDLFFFYREGGRLWHGGWKGVDKGKRRRLIKFYYEPFDLEETEFLGHRFRVPADTLRYLEAKYGKDWSTPIRVWDWAVNPANAVETDIHLKKNRRKVVR